MDERSWKRLRGLKRLVHDGVEHGANFVEKHHRHAADKPFTILESIQPIAAPTKLVRAVHDGVLTLTYGSIRVVNKATEAVDDWVVDRLEEETRAAVAAADDQRDSDAPGEPAESDPG